MRRPKDAIIPHIETRADTGEQRNMSGGGYSTDFAQWTADQARALRAAMGMSSSHSIDWENLAEEIEQLGKAQRRDLGSRITTILVHLIKLQASPAALPRHGWREAIQEQRDEIMALIEDSPSLESNIHSLILDKLPMAKRRARIALAEYGEQPSVDIESLTYNDWQVRGAWFPDET